MLCWIALYNAANAVHRGGSDGVTPKAETPPSGTQRATRRGKKATEEAAHKVEYMVTSPDGMKGKVIRTMSQAALSKLLLEDGIVLLTVNKPDPVYFPKKKKK